MNICLICHKMYSLDSLGFEQKLIEDKDFCSDCYNEFII